MVSDIGRLLTTVLQALVDAPDKVHITEIPGELNVVYEVRLAPDDYGKVIGKNGQHANAIRTIIAAVGRKHGRFCTLSIVDPPSRRRL